MVCFKACRNCFTGYPQQETLCVSNATDLDTCWQVGFNYCCSCCVSLCKQAISNGGTPKPPPGLQALFKSWRGPLFTFCAAAAASSLLGLWLMGWGERGTVQVEYDLPSEKAGHGWRSTFL